MPSPTIETVVHSDLRILLRTSGFAVYTFFLLSFPLYLACVLHNKLILVHYLKKICQIFNICNTVS